MKLFTITIIAGLVLSAALVTAIEEEAEYAAPETDGEDSDDEDDGPPSDFATASDDEDLFTPDEEDMNPGWNPASAAVTHGRAQPNRSGAPSNNGNGGNSGNNGNNGNNGSNGPDEVVDAPQDAPVPNE